MGAIAFRLAGEAICVMLAIFTVVSVFCLLLFLSCELAHLVPEWWLKLFGDDYKGE